ncbi:MAG: peptide ABC transporter substrate-binding protein [Thermomicrobiales bacterium]
MMQSETLTSLFRSLKAGEISRRQFVQRSAALGLSAAGIAFAVNSLDTRGTSAQDATPVASAGRPAIGMETATRGEGGALGVLLWQAVTHLSPHNSTGTKDQLGASFVLESLMNYAADSSLVPTLITEIPTIENGLLAEDLGTVTYKLLPGVVWSDGEPFTAKDVEFTYHWVMDPVHASISSNIYSAISVIEVVDDLTVKLTFASPTLAWWVPFTGTFNGYIYPGHLWGFDPANVDYDNTFRQNPTGTGPYKVDTFTENDQVTYSTNESFRDPAKPFFSNVNLKGGGDAVSAARAVLQTGDFDYAWNLQVEPAILDEMLSGGKGRLDSAPGASIEAIFINFTDPNTEVDGERSSLTVPHPSLSDSAVRHAFALAVDRQTINDQFYGAGSYATANRLAGIPAYQSTNVPFVFDPAAANQILDDAGWVLDGSVRKKGDVELKWTYSTSINAVRQKTQAVVKSNLAAIGIEVNLTSVDAGIYFDSSAGNDQNYPHFYSDITMYTNGPVSPFPLDYMSNYYAGPDNANVAQKSNDWSGNNISRYVNAEYDAMWLEAQGSTDPERVAELFIGMNDLLVNDAALVSLVQRSAGNAALSNRVDAANLAKSPFEGDFWNIMNWRTVI